MDVLYSPCAAVSSITSVVLDSMVHLLGSIAPEHRLLVAQTFPSKTDSSGFNAPSGEVIRAVVRG